MFFSVVVGKAGFAVTVPRAFDPFAGALLFGIHRTHTLLSHIAK